jgi:aminopeptidase YwaD
MAAHSGAPAELATQNIVAFLPGRDPALRGQTILIGAHIDHLGRSTAGALDPDARDAIRNGADDNASGTAVVLELARLLRATPPRRSVLFVNFSGEELGLLGSQYFVQHSPVPIDSIVAMLNFDMVGRLRGDSLIVYGVATAREMRAVIDSANAGLGLTVRGIGDGFGPSDHSSFFARDIPVLHFFTNLHDDYHRASDDAAKINAAGAARVVALAERVVREIDERDTRLTFVKSVAPAPVAGSRTGSNVYLGSIPDMSAPDAKGLRLTGVRAGSPADSAGLKAGDIVVEFGGKPVTDLQTYSDALYGFKPGDEVEIVVLRNGQRLAVKVRLGRRG